MLGQRQFHCSVVLELWISDDSMLTFSIVYRILMVIFKEDYARLDMDIQGAQESKEYRENITQIMIMWKNEVFKL